MPGFLKSALNHYPLVILSIPMVQLKWYGFLMQQSNIFLENTLIISISYSSSHSPKWSILYCSSLLVVVASSSPSMEGFQMVKISKVANIHWDISHTFCFWASLLDWLTTACSCCLVPCSSCQRLKWSHSCIDCYLYHSLLYSCS